MQALHEKLVVAGDGSEQSLRIKALDHGLAHRIIDLVENEVGLDPGSIGQLADAVGNGHRFIAGIDDTENEIAAGIDPTSEMLKPGLGIDENHLTCTLPQAGQNCLRDTADHAGAALAVFDYLADNQQLDAIVGFGHTGRR
ncbi:MAG: hypothetical protein ACD_75C01974G0003 [uncultured bacterium]|nr:MAG: hypothetical protein ACD_75C01974G0003 [uncultured bacterium]